MASFSDPLEDSKLILESEVYEGVEKRLTFLWIINNYDEIEKNILYRSHYIRISNQKHRFCLRRAERTERYSRNQYIRLELNLVPPPENLKLNFSMRHIASNYEEGFSNYSDMHYLNESCVQIKRNTVKIICKISSLDKDADIILPLNELDSYLDLSGRMNKLFVEGQFTDLKVLVGDEEFNVHKAVLACSSPVFAKMLQVDMKEKKENRILIKDFDSEVFRSFLYYIYSGRLKPLTEELALSLFKLADKYNMSNLKLQSSTFLSHKLNMKNVIELYKLADLCQEENLKSATLDFIASNLQEIMKSPEWPSLRASNSFMDYLLPILGELVL